MSSFKHIKTSHENLFKFARNHPDCCFYCKKERDLDMMHYLLTTNVGICKECFPDFRIGHLAADRHVVERMLEEKNYKRKADVVRWFGRQGYDLYKIEDFGDGGSKGTAYTFINNNDAFLALQERVKERKEPLPGGGYLTPEEDVELSRLFENGTRIEIFYNGGVHIV